MKELLHEQLREDKHFENLYDTVDANIESLLKNTFYQIADEIENNYVPYPRDEHGNIITIGSHVDGLKNEIENISIHIDEDGQLCYSLFDGDDIIVDLGAFKSKRLDADGVPCKVGDMVWHVNEPEKPGRVKYSTISKNDIRVEWSTGDESYTPSQYLVHEKPIFDAEGVRICKGETVWTLYTGTKFTVEGFADDGVVTVRFCEDANGLTTYAPKGLIHHEPDSYKKLLERMEAYVQKNEEYINRSIVGKFSKELRALIERGA